MPYAGEWVTLWEGRARGPGSRGGGDPVRIIEVHGAGNRYLMHGDREAGWAINHIPMRARRLLRAAKGKPMSERLSAVPETDRQQAAVKGHNGRAVAIIYGDSRAERAAMAELFAAAPETAAERDRLRASNAELLAALKAAKDQLDVLAPRADSSFRADFVKARKQVDAAIAKAEEG